LHHINYLYWPNNSSSYSYSAEQ